MQLPLHRDRSSRPSGSYTKANTILTHSVFVCGNFELAGHTLPEAYISNRHSELTLAITTVNLH